MILRGERYGYEMLVALHGVNVYVVVVVSHRYYWSWLIKRVLELEYIR